MIRPDVIYLIAENAATHGVHDTVEDVKRKVLCTVESVTRSEFYNALNVGIRPEHVFRIPIGDAYHDERLAELSTDKNRRGRPLIVMVPEDKPKPTRKRVRKND